MQDLQGRRILITGGTRGLGKAIVDELASTGAEITVIGRNIQKTALPERANIHVVAGDVTDENLINKVVRELKPAIMILNAGATPVMGSLEEQTWESFTKVWDTDVRAGLYGMQAALRTPLPPGGRVLIISSGAAMVGARLSGSYAGAKRMLWFMAQYASEIARERGLDIRFETIVPMQMMGETAFAQTIASAYAKLEHLSTEDYIVKRYGDPLSAVEYARYIVAILKDPANSRNAAYGIKKDTGIKLIDC